MIRYLALFDKIPKPRYPKKSMPYFTISDSRFINFFYNDKEHHVPMIAPNWKILDFVEFIMVRPKCISGRNRLFIYIIYAHLWLMMSSDKVSNPRLFKYWEDLDI